MRKAKKTMDWTRHNKVYMAVRYGPSNKYDDAWGLRKSANRYGQRNWKKYRRTQWKNLKDSS